MTTANRKRIFGDKIAFKSLSCAPVNELGVEPKGIIGCGYVTSDPYPLPHWDEEKAKNDKEALRTDLLI
jgi:hypothetical protein